MRRTSYSALDCPRFCMLCDSRSDAAYMKNAEMPDTRSGHCSRLAASSSRSHCSVGGIEPCALAVWMRITTSTTAKAEAHAPATGSCTFPDRARRVISAASCSHSSAAEGEAPACAYRCCVDGGAATATAPALNIEGRANGWRVRRPPGLLLYAAWSGEGWLGSAEDGRQATATNTTKRRSIEEAMRGSGADGRAARFSARSTASALRVDEFSDGETPADARSCEWWFDSRAAYHLLHISNFSCAVSDAYLARLLHCVCGLRREAHAYS